MSPIRTRRNIAALTALGACLAVLPGAAASATGTGDDSAGRRGARAVVRNVSGTVLGTIEFRPVRGKLAIGGRLSGLAPGFHGFHVHAVGVCDPAATDPTGTVVPFLSAGGHLNPGGTTHGHHAGDLPVLYVAGDGGALTVSETGEPTLAQVFDADGSAVIIHALPDNYANIPTRYSAGGVPGPDAATLATGDSGGRVACGVVTRS